MSDIMELIETFGNIAANTEMTSFDELKEIHDQIESRLFAMQEVCNVAAQAVDRNMINIHGKGCTCEHCNLIRAIDKLNEVMK